MLSEQRRKKDVTGEKAEEKKRGKGNSKGQLQDLGTWMSLAQLHRARSRLGVGMSIVRTKPTWTAYLVSSAEPTCAPTPGGHEWFLDGRAV